MSSPFSLNAKNAHTKRLSQYDNHKKAKEMTKKYDETTLTEMYFIFIFHRKKGFAFFSLFTGFPFLLLFLASTFSFLFFRFVFCFILIRFSALQKQFSHKIIKIITIFSNIYVLKSMDDTRNMWQVKWMCWVWVRKLPDGVGVGKRTTARVRRYLWVSLRANRFVDLHIMQPTKQIQSNIKHKWGKKTLETAHLSVLKLPKRKNILCCLHRMCHR